MFQKAVSHAQGMTVQVPQGTSRERTAGRREEGEQREGGGGGGGLFLYGMCHRYKTDLWK